MASIAILLIVLIVIIISMMNSSDFRMARQSRTNALKMLLSRNPGESAEESLNLHTITGSLKDPLGPGGSLDNLYHFLSKDPGRRNFSSTGDRRRAAEYFSGTAGIQAEGYAEELRIQEDTGDIPEWAPEYIAKVRVLFEIFRDDLMIITGIPGGLTDFHVPESAERSITQKTEMAVKQFAQNWIPRGKTNADYSMDRQEIRRFLLGNKRFRKRMAGLDDGWKELASSMYNLSMDSRWNIAVRYYPDFASELDELTTIVLAADIYRRNEDLLIEVSGKDGPGIMWLPEFSYYKNIPELTGQLKPGDPDNEEDVTIFFAKVNLGYSFRDGRTQTWLNRRKDWLTDYFNEYFSDKELSDFSSGSDSLWRAALLKGQGLHIINKKIVQTLPFGKKKVFGVRDLAFVKVNLMTNP